MFLINTYDGNRLLKVDDASGVTGFKDGANAGDDYDYDANGNLIKDGNKEISGITWNYLNLPETITFTNGDEVAYLYNAAGSVLQKTFLQGGVVSEQTDYLGGIEVNQDGHWTIYNEEGITLLQNGEGPGMRVFLRDHQGSTRVVLNPHPEDLVFTATMESELSADEEEWFGNLDTRVTMAAANHTPGGNEAARLNSDSPAGPSLVLAVYPGDVVDLETYAYYENFTANGTLGTTAMIAGIAGAFGGVSGGTEGQQMMFNVVNDALALVGLLGDNTSTDPQAYLNYILFDRNMNAIDFGFSTVSSSANLSHELLQRKRPTNYILQILGRRF